MKGNPPPPDWDLAMKNVKVIYYLLVNTHAYASPSMDTCETSAAGNSRL